jgi:hypothetical protein
MGQGTYVRVRGRPGIGKVIGTDIKADALDPKLPAGMIAVAFLFEYGPLTSDPLLPASRHEDDGDNAPWLVELFMSDELEEI